MIEVVREPFKKLVIHDVVVEPFNAFVDLGAQINAQPPKWCNGVLFKFGGLADTAKQAEEDLKGIIHWLWVEVTRLEKYKTMMKRGGVEVEIADVSNSPIYLAFTKWMKEQPEWKEEFND